MYTIKPSASIVFENVDVYSKLENIGRICYKSEELIKSTTYERFISNIIKRGHESVLEHHNFVCKVSNELYFKVRDLNPKYLNMTNYIEPNTGNIRYLVSGSARGFKDLWKKTKFHPAHKYLWIILTFLKDRYPILFTDISTIKPNKIGSSYVEKVLTYSEILNLNYQERQKHHFVSIKFICDRGISHEAVRHRTASFSQESTRYVNYSNGRYNSNITMIDPIYYQEGLKRFVWWFSSKVSELCYMILTKWLKSTPQEARSVLNNSLKTEFIMTTNIEGWEHFIFLRNHKTAHPQMIEVAEMVNLELTKKEYIRKEVK